MIIDKSEQYTPERFNLAIGTKDTYLSNFHQLRMPLLDDYGNLFWNSEGYYMALRTLDLSVKKVIAQNSKLGGYASRKARKQFDLNMDESARVIFMDMAIRVKFNANDELRELLYATDREIIEKNYWKDDLFGVRQDTLRGANILGKCLMNYRAEHKKK